MKKLLKTIAQKLPPSLAGNFIKLLWRLRKVLFRLFHPLVALLSKFYPGAFVMGGPARGVSEYKAQNTKFDNIYEVEETDAEFYGNFSIKDCANEFTNDHAYWASNLQDVIVDGATKSVHDNNGALITGCSPYARFIPQGFPYDHPSFWNFKPKQVKSLDGTTALIAGHNCHVYYHWLLQSFPKFHFLWQKVPDSEVDYYLIPPASKMVTQALEALGVPPEKCIHINDGYRYECKSLWVTNLFVPQFGVASIAKWMKRTFIQEVKADDEIPILFISRKKAGLRELIGGEKIENYILSVGGKSVCLEDYSLSEQAEFFHRAKVVVAPHGSSLTNIVYMKEGTKVVELFSSDYVRLCYARMGTRLNLDYHCFVDAKQSSESSSPGLYEDIRVNPEDVISLLRSF